MQLYCNYILKYWLVVKCNYIATYATICNYIATYATILQQFCMQLYATMQLCNMQLMQLQQLYGTYATLRNILMVHIFPNRGIFHIATILQLDCNYILKYW